MHTTCNAAFSPNALMLELSCIMRLILLQTQHKTHLQDVHRLVQRALGFEITAFIQILY